MVKELQYVKHFAHNAICEQRYNGSVIKPGTELNKGSKITLFVGLGTEGKNMQLPSLYGIPASEAEHVFERFVKLDSFKEGLGLGLTFGRTMARRMGGDVVLDTTFAGPGARFKVTLPLGERS